MLLSHFSTLRLYLLPKSKHYEFYHLSLHDALPIFARTAWLAAGGSEAVPGTTIDRKYGTGQQAIHFATQAVMSGTADLDRKSTRLNSSHVDISYALFFLKKNNKNSSQITFYVILE